MDECWTVGHLNIKGDERADQEAKLAAGMKISDGRSFPEYLHRPPALTTSAAKQDHNLKLCCGSE